LSGVIAIRPLLKASNCGVVVFVNFRPPWKVTRHVVVALRAAQYVALLRGVLNFRLLESRRMHRFLSHYSAAMN
jgi:hypothetical protein